MNRPAKRFQSIAFVASQTTEAREAYARLESKYGNADPAKADVIVALGGDGLMLQTLHKFMEAGKPIYGMHRGTVGFLMNEFSVHDLRARLAAAHESVIHPLLMRATDPGGAILGLVHVARAEAMQQRAQDAPHVHIVVDDEEAELVEVDADHGVIRSRTRRSSPCGS